MWRGSGLAAVWDVLAKPLDPIRFSWWFQIIPGPCQPLQACKIPYCTGSHGIPVCEQLMFGALNRTGFSVNRTGFSKTPQLPNTPTQNIPETIIPRGSYACVMRVCEHNTCMTPPGSNGFKGFLRWGVGEFWSWGVLRLRTICSRLRTVKDTKLMPPGNRDYVRLRTVRNLSRLIMRLESNWV